MSAKRTAWHPPFTGLLEERCPRWAKVTGEVQLTAEPLRVDDVIEVWVDRPHDPTDTGATLRGMWRFIVVVGVLEYKSVVWPFQHGDLSRLIAYGLLWRATHQRRDLHVVAELEDDDLLRGFAGRPQRTVEGRRWMRQHWSSTGETMSTNATPDLYGYDEFIEQYLGDLTPKQRLKGLAPEERLQELTEEVSRTIVFQSVPSDHQFCSERSAVQGLRPYAVVGRYPV